MTLFLGICTILRKTRPTDQKLAWKKEKNSKDMSEAVAGFSTVFLALLVKLFSFFSSFVCLFIFYVLPG